MLQRRFVAWRTRKAGAAVALALLCLAPVVRAPGAPERIVAAAAAAGIGLEVNGRAVAAEPSPLLLGGRVLVPVRFVAEALGLEVDWDGARVVIDGGGAPLELTAGDTAARVGSARIELDVAPRIIGDRVFVPLRFVAEAMGAEVAWLQDARVVRVRMPGAEPPVVPPLPAAGARLDLARAPLGATPEALSDAWGEPVRRDAGLHLDSWWVYRPAPDRYVRAGFRDGRLGALYAYGKGWSYREVSDRTAPGDAVERLGLGDRVELAWRGARYAFDCTGAGGGQLPPLVEDGRVVLLYTDGFDDRVVAAFVADATTFLRADPPSRLVGCTVRYQSAHPLPEPRTVTEDARAAALRGRGLTLLDLANVARRLHDRPALVWSEQAAAVAEAHSRDMFANRFFDHDSPTRGSLAERLRAAGLARCGAGENIARGFADALGAHHGWMNSEGHRDNLLAGGFRAYGAAAAGDYYTETFLHCPGAP